MRTGWRRAFCTTSPEIVETEEVLENRRISSPSPRSCAKFGFLTGGSNPSTPSLSRRSLGCSTTEYGTGAAETTASKTSKSNPTSPRTSLKLSLFRNSFKFRSSCGICLNSVKTGQGKAIYTAECSHAFHFPCIAEHVHQHSSLVCPVCNTTWKDLLLLATRDNPGGKSQNDEIHGEDPKKPAGIEDKKVIRSSSSRCVDGGNGGLKPKSKTPISRSYDDDEPLRTPRFVPIPEADENEEDDKVDGDVTLPETGDSVSEFQGCIVDPSTTSTEISSDGGGGSNVLVGVMPESAVVSVGRGHETYAVALKVKAPPPTPPTTAVGKAPIDVVVVLDVSPNMNGGKLQILNRAALLVISSLGSGDRLSIVVAGFSSSGPRRLLPLTRMTACGRRTAAHVVDRLVCGSHGFSAAANAADDALRKATKVLEDRRVKNPTEAIVTFFDGQDSSKQKNPRHVSSSALFTQVEIPVYSTGLGTGSRHAAADDLFTDRVGWLLSPAVQDLRVHLGISSRSSSPCEISGVYLYGPTTAVSSSRSVRVGDLYAGEEREILVELKVPAALATSVMLSSRCLHKDPSTHEAVYGREQELVVPNPHAVRSSSSSTIGRLRDRFVATRAIAESRRLAEFGNLNGAYHLLTSARALLTRKTDADTEEVRGVETELAEIQWRRQRKERRTIGRPQESGDGDSGLGNGDDLTPTSAWKAAEKLAKVAMMKKSMNKVSDLHGFENARF